MNNQPLEEIQSFRDWLEHDEFNCLQDTVKEDLILYVSGLIVIKDKYEIENKKLKELLIACDGGSAQIESLFHEESKRHGW